MLSVIVHFQRKINISFQTSTDQSWLSANSDNYKLSNYKLLIVNLTIKSSRLPHKHVLISRHLIQLPD